VGTLDAGRPLYRDACRNALRAMADPRLEPVTREEWPDLTVKVSVLNPPERVDAGSLDDLCALLRPAVDGLILAAGQRQATFLPAVWGKLPDPADFLRALLAKGGWPRDRLPDGARVQRYTADEFRDSRTHQPL
jgi:AmmeMemoRadiSam system protein A